MAQTSSTPRKGVSLAKGPVGLLGLAGVVYGVLALIFGGNSFALRIPHGSVGDGHFIGLYTNGWTDLLFVAAGLFLLLGSRVHILAKSNAVIVAIVLGAAAVVAAIRGNGVFGLFAANGRTEVIWGAAAIVLALLALLPRVGRRDAATSPGGDATTPAAPARLASVPDQAGDDPLISSR